MIKLLRSLILHSEIVTIEFLKLSDYEAIKTVITILRQQFETVVKNISGK